MFFKKLSILLLMILGSSFLFSQVKISADFDTGSIGSYQLVDSVWIKRAANDSILTLSYEIQSRFDPLNPIDTALRPSARWYHFRMDGVKDKQIFLTIRNSEVIRPFYSYDGVNYTRFEEAVNLLKGTVNTIFTQDTVYISHFVPYSYKRHKEKIDFWSLLPDVEHEVIGGSYLGLPIDMLTITDRTYSDINKRRVWIHGRSHPSESPSSWHLEAMIDEITSDSPFAKELRKNTIFFIIPFINPDGVIGGYSRSTSTGVNIEINWDRPDTLTMPEVKTLKRTLERVTSQRALDMMLNMHSQIANSITYWIHTAESTTDKFYKEQLLLSALTINYTPYYRPVDQRFSDVASRYAEGWIWDRFKDTTLAITFETPYTYYNEDRSGVWVSTENLKELAYSTLFAVSDILNLDRRSRIFADTENHRTGRSWSESDDTNNIFFGDKYLISQKKGARGSITIPNLSQGEYTLYKWITGPADKVFPEDTNIWQKEGYVTQRRDGRYRIRFRSTYEGEKFDSFLLIKKE
ncbi:MAG: M14-type cytosolic carboxypeptidase [Bacteroidales bacterium]|nr:M14-type cytosolic carboxypeptidase [Bacteroidales bacterium]